VKIEAPTIAPAELEERVHKNLATKGVRTWHLDVTEQDDCIPGEEIFHESDSLESAKPKFSSAAAYATPAPASTSASTSTGIPFPSFGSSSASPSAPSPMHYAESKPAPRSYSNQKANVYHDTVTKEQVSKVMRKNNFM